jgi:hypothetical protein
LIKRCFQNIIHREPLFLAGFGKHPWVAPFCMILLSRPMLPTGPQRTNHRVVATEDLQAGDIGLSLEAAETLACVGS